MSLQSLTVVCDYPGCAASLSCPAYPGVFHDYRWAAPSGSYFFGDHLCPKHRHVTREELTELLATMATTTPPEPYL